MAKKRNMCLLLLHETEVPTTRKNIECFEKETGIMVLTYKLEQKSEKWDIMEWMLDNLKFNQISDPTAWFCRTFYSEDTFNLSYFIQDIEDKRIERFLITSEDAFAFKMRWV